MPFMMPQVALHRIIQGGIAIVKDNPDLIDNIFQYYTCPEMESDYGQPYIDKIKKWFTETKIPVVQAWSLDPQRVPLIAIKLANDQEDESKAALGDHYGMGEEADIGTSPSVVHLDVEIRTSRNADEVLWLYYIITYILLKRKRAAERLGLQLYTWNASDYNRLQAVNPENVFSRYLRVRTIVQNFWDAEDYLDLDDVELGIDHESTTTE